MATNTPRLGLPRPEPEDIVTLANHNALIDAIDDTVASNADVAGAISAAQSAQSTANAAQTTADTAKTTAESHASRHAIGGADPLTPSDIGAATQAAFNSHVNAEGGVHGATDANTPSSIMRRNADGNTQVGNATAGSHAVSRNFGDGRYARTDQIARFSRVDVLSSSNSNVDLQVFRNADGDQIAKFRLNGDHTFRLEVNDGAGLTTALDFNRSTGNITNRPVFENGLNASGGSVSVANPTSDSHAVNRGFGDGRYARPDIPNTFIPKQHFNNGIRILDGGSSPSLDIHFANNQFEFYPTGSGFQRPIMIGREQNRVDMPGGATIEGNTAWHGGNNQSNNSVNGYQRLASGVIIQWGSQQVQSGNSVTFPITFPNDVYQVVATALGASGDPLTTVNISNPTNSGFTIYHDFSSDTQPDQQRRVRFIAIGN